MGLLSLLNFYCCRFEESAGGFVGLLSLLNFYCCRFQYATAVGMLTIKSFEFLLL